MKAKIKVVYDIEKVTAIIIITGKWIEVDYIKQWEKSNLLSIVLYFIALQSLAYPLLVLLLLLLFFFSYCMVIVI